MQVDHYIVSVTQKFHFHTLDTALALAANALAAHNCSPVAQYFVSEHPKFHFFPFHTVLALATNLLAAHALVAINVLGSLAADALVANALAANALAANALAANAVCTHSPDFVSVRLYSITYNRNHYLFNLILHVQ